MKNRLFCCNYIIKFCFVLLAVFCSVLPSLAQEMDRIERERAKDMLNVIKNELKKFYYDPNFHGLDLDFRFKDAASKIDEAKTIGQAHGIIAQAVMDLNDSHTVFIPPAKNVKVDYGFEMQMIGNKCFIVAVRPKSDAESKGLKEGDEVVAIQGFRPNRREMWKVMYYYYGLNPQARLQLLIQSQNDKEPRQLQVEARIKQKSRVTGLTSTIEANDFIREMEGDSSIKFHRFVETGNVLVWKPLSFGFDPAEVPGIVNRMKNKSTVIFDFRGNPGGLVVTHKKLVGYLFEKDVKIADVKERKKSEPEIAKTQGNDVYKGKIIVLIDSESGSAAEIFARLIQIEKRGIVIGDTSAGAVMQSRGHVFYMQGLGYGREIAYGISMTEADVIMTDGKSLEHVGVTPDESILPTAADIAARRDPVMVRALELAGVKISAEEAGKFFPKQWSDIF